MRLTLCIGTLLAIGAVSQLTACTIHRGPPRPTPRHGFDRVVLPAGIAVGDRVEIQFTDEHLVSARVVDWSSSGLVADYDGRRHVHPWHEIATVREHREPKVPTLAGAVRRFFFVIGVVALFASAAS